MISWLVGVVVCLAFLAGCGGGQKGALVKMDPVTPEVTAPVIDDNADDAALTEELSPNRVEELYAKSGIPGSDPGLEEELQKWEHQAKFDVPIQMNKQVRAYLVYFSTERKAVITRYLARSTRYLPMIKEVFQEAGLPEDLAYLAMIESGFNNKAYSRPPPAACGSLSKAPACAMGSLSTATWMSAGTRKKPPGRQPNISWTSTSNSAPGIWLRLPIIAVRAECSGS